MKRLAMAAILALAAVGNASAQIRITEVTSWASTDAPYGADWFELTNTGAAPIDITGWKVDDGSNSFASALALRSVTIIQPGQSAVFAESNADGTDDAFVTSFFIQDWFGGMAPAGFALGTYGGSGIGLSTSGDAVNIFDAAGVKQAGVTFGAAASGFTFDNAAGLNNAAISWLSANGVNGAFASATGDIGSPGTIGVPEPAAATLAALAGLSLAIIRRKK
jgi:hypothetical protein